MTIEFTRICRRAWIWLAFPLSGCAAATPAPAPTPEVAETPRLFSVSRVEQADVLFVIDNSNSMAAEQAALRAQIPHLVDVLTRGERYPGDPQRFTPILDLHVGVVTTDMGIPGINYGACHADGGDDGRLQHAPHAASGLRCAAEYPAFLSLDAQADQDVEQFATDVACITAIGTSGCGFEQQLEAGFKALWPSPYADNPLRYTFLSTSPSDTAGRGDRDNSGFLREDSLLLIVLLTDEDDCSVRTGEHLWPANILPPGSPYAKEDVNLRCILHPEFQYDLAKRYYDGFRALRPGREDRVVFTAIAGVPPDLVDELARAIDFSDPVASDRFYDDILKDARMQQKPDPATNPGSGMGNIKPSCVRFDEGGAEPAAVAYPPRRIVELAKLFGENGMVQSICQNDFGPAIDSFLGVMSKPINSMCVRDQLQRAGDGRVDCKMYWTAADGCESFRELLAEGAPADGERCEIRQLAAHDGEVEAGEGFYFDDLSGGACAKGRFAQTAGAQTPKGVSVKVECGGTR